MSPPALMAMTLFVLFIGSMALSAPPTAPELAGAALTASPRAFNKAEEQPFVSPTPLPQDWLDNASQTNGMIFGAVVLVLIVLGGTLSAIRQKHRIAHPPRK